MIQMLFSKLLVSVSSCGDVEVSLHLISVQTSVNPARIRRALELRRLAKLLLLCFPKLLMHIPQLFPPRVHAIIFAQLVHALLHLLACPLRPVRGVVAQKVASKRAIASGVLHVYAQVGAAHSDDDVEIYLHIVRNAFLDGEGLDGGASVPACDLGPGEVYACEDEGYGPCRGIAPLDEVGLFGFGCERLVSIVSQRSCVLKCLGRVVKLMATMKLDCLLLYH